MSETPIVREPGHPDPLPNLTTICTIGFAGLSSKEFFELMAGAEDSAGVTRLVDVRRRPYGDRTFYTNAPRDLPWLLKKICDISYSHVLEFAPSPGLLGWWHGFNPDEYEEQWPEYVRRFREEVGARHVFDPSCMAVRTVLHGQDKVIALLCTEENPLRCHRSVVAERIAARYPGLTVKHLVKAKPAKKAR